MGQDGALLMQEGRLTLDASLCWVDTWALEELASEIDRTLKVPRERVDDARIPLLAERLIALYRGPFLAGDSDEPWQIVLRERLRARFVRAIGDISRHWQRAGQWDRAVDCLQRSLEADSLAEGFYRHLMLCYSELGRSAEAIDIYERCRRTLAAVLSVEPSPETTTLYQKLLVPAA